MEKFFHEYGYHIIRLDNLTDSSIKYNQREFNINNIETPKRLVFDLSYIKQESVKTHFIGNYDYRNIYSIPMSRSLSGEEIHFSISRSPLMSSDFVIGFGKDHIKIIKNRYGEDNSFIKYTELW